MNNSISIIMLGLVLAVCISFVLKGLRTPEPEKETQRGTTIGLAGSAVGFIVGFVLGVMKPQAIFSNSFLKHEGAELGAIVLMAIGFSVVGAIGSLLIYGFSKKRKA